MVSKINQISPFRMKVFAYRDNSLPLVVLISESPIILEAEVSSIADADKLFSAIVGESPVKMPHVGLTISGELELSPPDAGKLEWIERGGYTPFALP